MNGKQMRPSSPLFLHINEFFGDVTGPAGIE